MTDRRPGAGRYAHIEREQRWLVAAVPQGAVRAATITDRYIDGTTLRLRRADSPDGTQFKLTQKVRVDPADPEVVKLTTMYLPASEFAVLRALPASELRKTRWHHHWLGRVIAIDQFHGRLHGLFLAEAEIGAGDARLPPPDYAVRDVTNDDRFSGGALASAGDAQIELLLGDGAG